MFTNKSEAHERVLNAIDDIKSICFFQIHFHLLSLKGYDVMDIMLTGNAPGIKIEDVEYENKNSVSSPDAEEAPQIRKFDILELSENYRQKLNEIGIDSNTLEEITVLRNELIEGGEEISDDYNAILASEAAKLKPVGKPLTLSEMTDNYVAAYNKLYNDITEKYSGEEKDKRIDLLNTAAETAAERLSKMAVNQNKFNAALKNYRDQLAQIPGALEHSELASDYSFEDVDENIGQRLLDAIHKKADEELEQSEEEVEEIDETEKKAEEDEDVSDEDDGEERSGKTTVAVNVEKRQRQIAAAHNTKELNQVLSLLAEDLADCKEGLANGWCDESEVAKAEYRFTAIYELTMFSFYLRQTQYYTYRNVKTDVEATYRQVRKISELLLFMSENNIHFFSSLQYETNKTDEKYRELVAKKADEKDIAEVKKRRDTLAECYTTYLDCMKTDYERIVEESREYYRLVSDSVELEPKGVPLEINYFAEVSKESVTPQSEIDNGKWLRHYGISEQEEEIAEEEYYDYGIEI